MINHRTYPTSCITIKGPFPYIYGNDHILRIAYRRVQVLLTGHYTNYTPIKERIVDWVTANEKQIKKAYETSSTDTAIVTLPFQNLFLSDLNNTGFLKLQFENNKLSFTVSDRNLEKINFNSLSKDLAREILLVLIVGTTKTLISSPRSDLVTTLTYTICMGCVKGIVKSLSDRMIYKKKFTLYKMFSKCFSDAFAEVVTALCIPSSHEALYLKACRGGVKGFFKYIVKHLIQRTSSLWSLLELSLEIFQGAFKAYLRAYSFSILSNLMPSLIPMLCILPGALLGALLVNIFIVHCTL